MSHGRIVRRPGDTLKHIRKVPQGAKPSQNILKCSLKRLAMLKHCCVPYYTPCELHGALNIEWYSVYGPESDARLIRARGVRKATTNWCAFNFKSPAVAPAPNLRPHCCVHTFWFEHFGDFSRIPYRNRVESRSTWSVVLAG